MAYLYIHIVASDTVIVIYSIVQRYLRQMYIHIYIYICVFIHNYIFSMVFLYGTNLVLIGISNGIILSNFWDFGELFEFYWDIFRDNGDISLPGSSRDGVLSN